MFTDHTLDTAPPAARPAMAAVAQRMGGRVPPAVARMANSPELLDGFLTLTAAFDRTTLDPLAREVVVMAVAVRHDCHVCVELHTRKLRALKAAPELIDALNADAPLPDDRLEAVRRFVAAVYASAGAVPADELADFLSYGFTERNALEVVMGIGTYTLSTFANRLTGV
ncbi:carboxymuconolactone decarboxylase family protein [Streptomyces lichenis]|uniref:Carboxymuconolactone decarboxylase family protein n=1 Tax=Streptomyces lichenis TaxID=2306967 RepID=A0ABT0ID21_9ACTN|nr:carboxymuconolactone decarboxylase family protein [Streptomyces lichenis]MCK8679223.1 carboxymuconolactone decarboxylase family protein [Streptomyces lichenis]